MSEEERLLKEREELAEKAGRLLYEINRGDFKRNFDTSKTIRRARK